MYLSSCITFKGRLQSGFFFFLSLVCAVHSNVPKPRTPICSLAGGLSGKPVAKSAARVAVAF